MTVPPQSTTDTSARPEREAAYSQAAVSDATDDGSRIVVLRAAGSVLAAGVLLGSTLYLLSEAVADTDFWGHLRFGLDKLQARTLRLEDTYSYLTAGQTWYNHESLAEVVFAAAYSLAGGAGLIGLKLAVALTVVTAIYLRLYADGLTPLRAALVLLPAGVQLWMGFVVIRPQMFTILFFTFLLLVLVAAERRPTPWVWALPILFLVWINTHGGVLAGLGVFAVWLVVRAVTEPKLVPRLAALAAATGAAVMVTPYGPGMLEFLIRTTTVPRPEIAEWHPFPLMSLRGYAYIVLVAICGVGWYASSRPRRPPAFAVFLCAVLLPLTAQRHLYLFAIAASIVSAEHIADVWNRWRPRPRPPAVLAGAALATALAFTFAMSPDLGCVRVDVEHRNPYPARAVAWLAASGLEANLAVPCFCWGEYVIWHAGPRMRVSVDARRETVYPEEVWQTNLDMHHGRGDWDALLRDPSTDLVLVQQGSATNNLMNLHPRWVLAYEDETSAVYGRSGSPLLEELRNVPVPDVPHDGAAMCFG